MATANVDARDMLERMNLTFTIRRATRIRMWIGARVLILGAIIIGTSFVIVEVDDPSDIAKA